MGQGKTPSERPAAVLLQGEGFISATPTAFHVVLKNMNYVLQDSTTQDNRVASLMQFCDVPRTRDEMQTYIGIINREYFRKNILKPLLDAGQLRMTIPNKPNSRNQKYVND